MCADQSTATAPFDIADFTSAPLQMDMRIRFRDRTPEEVFDIMGDPERIKDWYLLAEAVHLHEPSEDGMVNFDVEFMLLGLVRE